VVRGAFIHPLSNVNVRSPEACVSKRAYSVENAHQRPSSLTVQVVRSVAPSRPVMTPHSTVWH